MAYTDEFYCLSSRCGLSMTDEQQTAKYISGLKYHIQERVILHDVFSVDGAHNKAMKIERLHNKSPPLRRLMSTEEPLDGERIQSSFTTVYQPPTQQMVKAPILTPTTNPTVAEGKENLYNKSEIGKRYRCGEPEHKFNECPKRRQVNMADYGAEDEEVIVEGASDSDFVEEHGDPIACDVQKLLCNQKSPTPRKGIKSSTQGVRSRSRHAILSSIIEAARTSYLKHS